jgi:hypothetical protein
MTTGGSQASSRRGIESAANKVIVMSVATAHDADARLTNG